MRRRIQQMPSFFKVWLTFIVCFISIVFGGIFFIGYKVSTTSPEEIGTMIGVIMRSIEDARKKEGSQLSLLKCVENEEWINSTCARDHK